MPSRRELANAIRVLSIDAIQRANSGHPGMPMGMADMAEVLWNDFMKHNPKSPNWWDRDRFILSNGHGSMLLYSLLHLTGYELSLQNLKDFRQLHSPTAGHPEYGMISGVEMTTGPLGQGLASAVGMALAEKNLAAKYNREGHSVVDHHTYVFAGDGCLMEGVSHEACSLAGTLGLGKLVVLYDDNGISIDGRVEGWFTDDTAKRFEAYGWQVVPKVDGHDPEAIRTALDIARGSEDRPTLICCQTVIGYGSPNKADTSGIHGSPLGAEEIAKTRSLLGWEHAPFVIPEQIKQSWDATEAGAKAESAWEDRFKAYRAAYPDLAGELTRRMEGKLPENWAEMSKKAVEAVQKEGKSKATRASSLQALNLLGPSLPELLGGAADLAGSNKTLWSGCKPVSSEEPDGNYIYYGVREFAMSAMINGLALHGGFIPYGGTFLVFSDYARNALRLAALMKSHSIFVYTHDSIGLGEDGPTHQPIEHVHSLQLIPGMKVWRPCDTTESVVAWKDAIENSLPSCLLFSRQATVPQPRNAEQLNNIQKGAYILQESEGTPDVLLMATGSEVEIVTEAAALLRVKGHKVQVVSMPCRRLFEQQDAAYREKVLPTDVKNRVAVEAGVTDGWYRYVGDKGHILGIDTFGESAPAEELYKLFGLTPEKVVEAVEGMFA